MLGFMRKMSRERLLFFGIVLAVVGRVFAIVL
jgi:predicted tellurium resistance membrane protein TerC